MIGASGVSVILPVYFPVVSEQRIRLLQLALESVLDQSLPVDFEIILIDDGSPKPIQDLSAQLGAAGKLIRWIRLQRNRGLVYALNQGIRNAKNQLIARIDADDRWRNGKLAKQLDLFASDGDVTVVGTGMARVREDGRNLDFHVRPGDWAGILRFFVESGCPFPHGSVIGRREIFRLLGGYPHDAGVRHCEDYALWGLWLRFFKPGMVEEVLYDYTVSSVSVSTVFHEQQAKASKEVRCRFAVLNLDGGLPDALNQLSLELDLNLQQSGTLCYRLWNHDRVIIRVPSRSLTTIASILPDRDILIERNESSAVHYKAFSGNPQAKEGERLLPIRAIPRV